MLIDGEWVSEGSGGSIDVENPARQEIFAQIPAAGPDQIDAAVDAADRAFAKWKAAGPLERAKLLFDASVLVRHREEAIASLMTQEEGKPFNEALGEVRKGAEILRFYGEEAKRLDGHYVPGYDPSTTSYVVYEPVGVSVGISPWNYPVELVAWKIGGALAAGATMVLKAPSETPLSPRAFVECVHDAGAPPGTINLLFGRGSVVGPPLVKHPKVKRVAFTGSTEVGRQIVAWCAEGMKKVSLELGGHCPMIVSDKAALSEAVGGATRRSFRNMGQICIAINRIYVQQSVYEEFLQAFVAATEKLAIGDGLERRDADLGPMASGSGLEKTTLHVKDALSKGARLLTGGKAPDGFTKGYFYEPTILADCTKEMLIMTEETFGPAVGVAPYETTEEAIAMANDTEYGLATYVYTDDLHESDAFMRGLEAGNVSINNPDAGVINAPYGGFKESGMGYEHGRAGLDEYLRAKHVRTRYYTRRR
jgi:succinate-semialdehyde dehydrogenase/glutarate-semialdehyde dehydrogenase